jgi:hypothetical protein
VLVAVAVLFAPPMFVTGGPAVVGEVDADVDMVAFDDRELPDGDGRIVAIVLPWKNEGSVTPGRSA